MDNTILTVSELTYQIKTLLESNFPFIWVEGEISNLTLHSSGHYFFTLKDEKAQIRGVMFRYQAQHLKFRPEDGIKVVVRGRIGVYEPRGEYQILTDFIEPKGKGALQLAFEQTKKRLEAEGLFDPSLKKPLPLLPQKIAIITSPTGAAIRDMLRIIGQRFANLEIVIIPVRVQGAEAPEEIVVALELVDTLPDIDVVILGRGGGSIEDLWAFNDERVARAIAKCKIPVVSAVGHEIDFTISDFVADVRAPTPSAAAEMVVEKKESLVAFLDTLKSRLDQGFYHSFKACRNKLEMVQKGLLDPRKKLSDLNLRSDELAQRLEKLFFQNIQSKIEKRKHLLELLLFLSPTKKLQSLKEELSRKRENLETWISWKMERCVRALEKSMAQLDAASPLNILKRGYSIARTWPDKKIVRDARTLTLKQELNVRLYKGEIFCKIERIKKD